MDLHNNKGERKMGKSKLEQVDKMLRSYKEEKMRELEEKISKAIESTSVPDMLYQLTLIYKNNNEFKDVAEFVIREMLSKDFFENAELTVKTNYLEFTKENVTIQFPSYHAKKINVFVKLKEDLLEKPTSKYGKFILHTYGKAFDFDKEIVETYDKYVGKEISKKVLKTKFKKNIEVSNLIHLTSTKTNKENAVKRKRFYTINDISQVVKKIKSMLDEVEKDVKKLNEFEFQKSEILEKEKTNVINMLKEDFDNFVENGWSIYMNVDNYSYEYEG